MFQRFEHRAAATLRRSPAIRGHCHEHDQRTRHQTTNPMQHQHTTDTMLTAKTLGIGLDPLFTETRIMHKLQGIQLITMLILRTHATQEHSTGRISSQPRFQLLPRIKRLVMNHHPYRGTVGSAVGLGWVHLSHR